MLMCLALSVTACGGSTPGDEAGGSGTGSGTTGEASTSTGAADPSGPGDTVCTSPRTSRSVVA